MTYSYDYRTAGTTAKLSQPIRTKANAALARAGLDGNGRYPKVGAGIVAAFDVLAKFGIEQDETMNAHMFSNPEGRVSLNIALTNQEDPFSPTSISNSVLAFTWAEVASDRFEVLAYLS